jgi:F-type H+-transporting ATPase subunit epsilon
MARTLLCEVVTPERVVYTNEVTMVVAPTVDGEIGILPLHVPLVSVLSCGEIRVRYGDQPDEVEWIAVSGGYVQVHEDKVIVLADDAALASQIDVERAKQGLALAQEELKKSEDLGDHEQDRLERDLKWHETQVAIASRKD